MTAKDEEIAAHAIELSDPGKPTPYGEAEPREESDARSVVREDEPEQRGEPKGWCSVERARQKGRRHPLPLKPRGDVHAQLGGSGVGGSTVERLEAEPSGHGLATFSTQRG